MIKMTKQEQAKRYAGDEHQPDYHAFLAGWDAVVRELKRWREENPSYAGYPDDLAVRLEKGEM